MQNNIKLCVHCMAKVDTDSIGSFCANCGKKHSVHYAQSYELPAGTYLNSGRYFVGESIGSGGFGISYIGYDFRLDKKVLIKETYYNGVFKRNCYDKSIPNPLSVTYRNEFSLDEIMRKTKKECLALSECEGLKNIVKVYDWFSENDTAYIITEFIDGVTLDEWVGSHSRFNWYDLYRNLKPLMYSLATLHSRGIIHRDIKPQNIMIRNDSGEFVLIDFGLARSLETKTLASVGVSFSPGYSPFEQRSFTKMDNTYTDIYELAATIYFALTGEHPSINMYEYIDGNFPRINVLHKYYNVPENVVKALRYALNPNYNLRCSNVIELIQMFEEVNEYQPHYLRGRLQQPTNDVNYPKNYNDENILRRNTEDREQIRNDYLKRKDEQNAQYEKQLKEIQETLDSLQPKYAKKPPKPEANPIDLKSYILPTLGIIVIILILMFTK